MNTVDNVPLVSTTMLFYVGVGAAVFALLMLTVIPLVRRGSSESPIGAYAATTLLFIGGVFMTVTAIGGIGAAGTVAGVLVVVAFFAILLS